MNTHSNSNTDCITFNGNIDSLKPLIVKEYESVYKRIGVGGSPSDWSLKNEVSFTGKTVYVFTSKNKNWFGASVVVDESTGAVKIGVDTLNDFWYDDLAVEVPENLTECVCTEFLGEFEPIAFLTEDNNWFDQHIISHIELLGINTNNLDEACENMISANSIEAAEKFIDDLNKLGILVVKRKGSIHDDDEDDDE